MKAAEIKLAAFQYHHAIGQREVMDHMEDMRKEMKPPRKDLPPEFTAAARGEKPAE